MKVLLTGAGGFLGRMLQGGLVEHHPITMGRGDGMDIRVDIGKPLPDLSGFDFVVHAAGKAHMVPKNEREAAEFIQVNHGGTINLLNALVRNSPPPSTFVLISTVAVYGLEEGEGVTEKHPLNAETPYAVSKKLAEEAVEAWAQVHGVSALMLRLPLVVGKGAPGNLGAMERHLRKGSYLRIGEGAARRSMVLGTDLARLVSRLHGKSGIYHLTDGYHPSFRELDTYMATRLGTKVRSIPESLARLMARVGDFVPGSPFNTYRFEKLSRSLTFDDSKAVEELGWSPTPVVDSGFLS